MPKKSVNHGDGEQSVLAVISGIYLKFLFLPKSVNPNEIPSLNFCLSTIYQGVECIKYQLCPTPAIILYKSFIFNNSSSYVMMITLERIAR